MLNLLIVLLFSFQITNYNIQSKYFTWFCCIYQCDLEMFCNAFKKLLRKGKRAFLVLFAVFMLMLLMSLIKGQLEGDQASLVLRSIEQDLSPGRQSVSSEVSFLQATQSSAKKFPLIHRTRLLTFTSCPSSVFVLILVSSNVQNFDRRALIRQTWGIDNAIIPRWLTVFLLGNNNNGKEMKAVGREAKIYDDMVQADYKEGFFNMTYKVAMGFEWAVKHCKFDYLLKADDDVFVNSFRLLDFLTSPNTPKFKLFTGNILMQSPVLRKGRYGVPFNEYNQTVFKPYCSGGGIVFSRDVIVLLAAMFDVVRSFRIDDAYLGILAEKAGVKPVHNVDFKMYEDKCEYSLKRLFNIPQKAHVSRNCLIKCWKSSSAK